MFNWPSYAIGVAISHELTIVNVNRQKKLIRQLKYSLTDAMIHQGKIINLNLLLKLSETSLKGHSLALVINDDWIEQQTFATHHAPKKAVAYLIKQKIVADNLYDYHLYQDHCTLWQLSKARYQSYLLFAKKLGLTLTSLEPYSSAQVRLLAQNFPQPYAIYYAPILYIIHNDKIIFSHQVLQHNVEQGIQLFEKLHPHKIHQLVTNTVCRSSVETLFINLEEHYGVESDFLNAYSSILRA